MENLTKICTQVVFLWFLLQMHTVFAQDKKLQTTRILQLEPALKSENPALLQTLKKNLHFEAKTYFHFGKGDFVNYFEADRHYKIGAETSAYHRLGKKTSVCGLASYHYKKGKNSSGSTFLYPYKTPFNFTPKDQSTKGDRRTEQYRLAGGFAYEFLRKLTVGAKIDYKTTSFAKLKDMRNINDILAMSLSAGLSYALSQKHTLGIAYTYKRYIENVWIDEYGKLEKDYYALINRGCFMGRFQLYGDDGILNKKNKKPWVDLQTHYAGQYKGTFSENVNLLLTASLGKGRGHYGNNDDKQVVYMKHQQHSYALELTLSIKNNTHTHLLAFRTAQNHLQNKAQLYKEVSTPAGGVLIEYYGQQDIFRRKKYTAYCHYLLLWGDEYEKAPWQLSVTYARKNIKRRASYYPYFRKQNITRESLKIGLAKAEKYAKTHLLLKYGGCFTFGSGGNPIDGKYSQTNSNASPPDYLNTLLDKEREYLTAKQLHTTLSLRAARDHKNNAQIYLQTTLGHTKAFGIKQQQGVFFDISLSAGVAF